MNSTALLELGPERGPSRNRLVDASIWSGKCSMDQLPRLFAKRRDSAGSFVLSRYCSAKLQWQWRRFRCHGRDRLTFPTIKL